MARVQYYLRNRSGLSVGGGISLAQMFEHARCRLDESAAPFRSPPPASFAQAREMNEVSAAYAGVCRAPVVACGKDVPRVCCAMSAVQKTSGSRRKSG